MATTKTEILTALEFDATTGESVERKLTAQEIAEYKALEDVAKTRLTETEAKAAARISALAKLADLGLTEEELGAL